MADFFIKTGDTAPAIVAVLKDANETVVNLTGTTVRFIMTDKTTLEKVVDGSASVTDAANGRVSYQWVTGDTDTPDTYNAEFEVSWPDGTYETFPNVKYIQVKVSSDLGGVVPV